MTSTELLMRSVRTQLTLVGPPTPQSTTQGLGLRYCRQCTPEPPVFVCPVCDQGSTEKWRWQLHIMAGPLYCAEWGQKKAAAWSRNA